MSSLVSSGVSLLLKRFVMVYSTSRYSLSVSTLLRKSLAVMRITMFVTLPCLSKLSCIDGFWFSFVMFRLSSLDCAS